jgi:hypothetical protein
MAKKTLRTKAKRREELRRIPIVDLVGRARELGIRFVEVVRMKPLDEYETGSSITEDDLLISTILDAEKYPK